VNLRVRVLLRTALAQYKHCSRTPVYAIVDETIKVMIDDDGGGDDDVVVVDDDDDDGDGRTQGHTHPSHPSPHPTVTNCS
jgi:hypothetical protein